MSKALLVRYDEQDQQDVQFLMGEGGATLAESEVPVGLVRDVALPRFRRKSPTGKLEN